MKVARTSRGQVRVGSEEASRWASFEARLRAEREEVDKALAADTVATEELAEGWQDRDSPSEDEIREMEYAQRQALRWRLRLVDEALNRLNAGTYGSCRECSASIGLRCLETDPATPLCVSCQVAAEGGRRKPTL
ncbi:MAG: hypothetical protein HY644_07185 [Acidobacteria bacterium]|nr:hypothetical protein [Acidobacteriota bacterium]